MAGKSASKENDTASVAELKKKVKQLRQDLKKSERTGNEARLKMAALQKKIRLLETERDIYRQISSVTTKAFNLNRLLNKYMDLVLHATNTEAGTIYIYNEELNELEFKVARGAAEKKLTGRKMPATEGIAGWVVRTGEPYVAVHAKKDPRWSSRISREINFDTHDILCVPLKSRDNTIGAIEVINREGDEPFTKADMDSLIALAGQISVVLENARLFESSRRQAEQFAMLAQLSTILNSNLDTEKVREKAMEAITRLLDCEVGSLLMLDEETNELYFEVALGEKGEAVKEIRLKMGEGIAGWVAKYGKPLLIPDTSKDKRWASHVDKKSKFRTKNMVCVPVRNHDKIIGVMQAINKQGDETFNSFDLELLISLSDQVAIAIENANLYEEQQRLFFETAEALAEAIEKRDPYTGGHTRRVSDYSEAIGKYLPLSENERYWLKLAAILHDVGKIGVPENVLNKISRLDEDELEEMKKHPQHGYEILKHIKKMQTIIPGMKGHHERYDGRGYPDGLRAEKIPLIARIIAVADTYDAMTTDRPYRKALPREKALRELEKYKGIQFDPKVVAAFKKAYKNGEIDPGRKKMGRFDSIQTIGYNSHGR